MLFLVPLNLIQVQHFTATAAGAALLPFSIVMFTLSRWSGGLVARIGSRIPLTVGPAVAALGFVLFARTGLDEPYWAAFFPAVIVLGLGMAITVAPLTTTVMSAVEPAHAGVASGVNNAVARVAGLLAIAILGVVLVSGFDRRIAVRLDSLGMTGTKRAAIDRQLPQMAAVRLESVPSLDPTERDQIRRAIDEAFVSSFRVIMLASAALALGASAVGSRVR
jgi:MFS family permease